MIEFQIGPGQVSQIDAPYMYDSAANPFERIRVGFGKS